MTEEFNRAMAKLRDLADRRHLHYVRLKPDEARVIVLALDAWREVLLKLAARDYSEADRQAHVADALGISVAELERMVDE